MQFYGRYDEHDVCLLFSRTRRRGGGADLGFGPKRIEGPGRKCLSGIRRRNLDRESAEGTKSFSG